ncbi:hypothetical protein GGF43_002959, partial [Coemansia sp. RSA 2618]
MSRKRTRSEFEEDLLHQFDWTCSEDMSYWSLTSLTTDGTDISMTSMLTPSPELTPTLGSHVSYSSNDETLAATYSSERKQSFGDDNYVRNKRLAKSSTANSSQAVPVKLESGIANSDQRTPEKLAESYRPSGSPTRVSGSKVVASVKFTEASDRGLCKVDKSLVCKGFWETIEEAGRICLPRRSGKTYNLTQLLLFFSQSPEQEYLTSIPDSIIERSQLGTCDIAQLDLATKCRLKRECLFKDSLLQTMHPKFFREHFMR